MSSTWGRLQAVAVSSSVGQGLLLAAFPMIAVQLTTDPQEVSLVRAVGQLPWLLLSLFVGVLLDRVRRSSVLTLAGAVLAVAAALLVVVPPSIPLLLVAAFAVATAHVLGENAMGSLIPEVVGPDRFAHANARLLVLDQGLVNFIVPPLAGFIVAWGAGAPGGIAFAAALVALLLSRLIVSAPPAPSDRHPMRDIAEGLKFLVRTRLLRSITFMVAVGSFCASSGHAMLVLYAHEVLGLGNVGFGVLLACLAAGWVASSFFVDRIIARLGYAWSMRIAQSLGVVFALLIAVAPPWPWLVGLILFLLTASTLIWNVCSQTSRQRFTPPHLLGRVLAGHKMLAWGPTPLGALAGGFIAAQFDLRSVWLMQAVVLTIGLGLVWRELSPSAFRSAEAAVS